MLTASAAPSIEHASVHIIPQQDVEMDWLPRGYSCDERVDPPGAPCIACRHTLLCCQHHAIVLLIGTIIFWPGSS